MRIPAELIDELSDPRERSSRLLVGGWRRAVHVRRVAPTGTHYFPVSKNGPGTLQSLKMSTARRLRQWETDPRKILEGLRAA